MSDLELALRTTNIFLAAVVGGATVFFQGSLVPIMRSWPEALALRLHQDFVATADPDRFIKPAGVASLLCGILALVFGDHLSTTSIVLTTVGLGLFAGVGAISELVNVPINRWAGRWSGEEVPPEYLQLRGRWERAHELRTLLAAAGLVFYILGALEAV